MPAQDPLTATYFPDEIKTLNRGPLEWDLEHEIESDEVWAAGAQGFDALVITSVEEVPVPNVLTPMA